jgi:hypothetical protein
VSSKNGHKENLQLNYITDGVCQIAFRKFCKEHNVLEDDSWTELRNLCSSNYCSKQR